MPPSPTLTALRAILASLYPTVEDARRIAGDVGLNLQFITFEGKAVNTWSHILNEAEKRGKLSALIDAVLAEYPEQEAAIQQAWSGDTVATTQRPLGRTQATSTTIINTSGGTYIAGNVHTEGDFVGRSKNTGDVVYGDKVMGDKVMGDKVSGDKISVGNIEHSSNIAIGKEISQTVTTHAPSLDIATLFAPILEAIGSLEATQRTEAERLAHLIQSEAVKGSRADDGQMGRAMDRLGEIAPTTRVAMVKLFASPRLAGTLGPLTQFIVEKMEKG